MGVMKDQASARARTKNAQSTSRNWNEVNAGNQGVGVSWSDVDPSLIVAVIHACTREGMAISFAATASGKGVSVTILDGAERPRFPCVSVEDADNTLRKILSQFD